MKKSSVRFKKKYSKQYSNFAVDIGINKCVTIKIKQNDKFYIK